LIEVKNMNKNEEKRDIPRESDNPMVEEYKEDLLQKPSSTVRDEERLIYLEGLASELLGRVESLERRIKVLEERR
jgi:hypothetical protein